MVLPHGNGYPITFYPDSVLDGVNKKEFNDVNHYTQFLDAIEGKDTTLAGFDYADRWPSPYASVWLPANFPANA